MFLHIGNNIIIELNKIIGIYNIESIENTKEYKRLIEELSEKRQLENNKNLDDKKSIIITKEKNGIKGFYSNISSVTLAKRAENKIETLGGF